MEEKNYKKGAVKSKPISYPTCASFTEQSRVTDPAWMYRDLEQVNWSILPLDPQENTCMKFQNNLNTRLLERDHYVPKHPHLLQQRGEPIGVFPGNKFPNASLKKL